MCFGVTAGAYILTLFAVCASSELVHYIYFLSIKKFIELILFSGKV